MKIKVCGNTLPHQVSALDDLGVTFAGFIFYPKSPRYMAQKISPEKMRQIKGKIIKVGVFVNPAYEELMKTVDEYRCSCTAMKARSSVIRSPIIFL